MESILKTLIFANVIGGFFSAAVMWLLVAELRRKDVIILTMKMQGNEPDRDILLNKKEEPEEEPPVTDNYVRPEDMTQEEIEKLS